MEIINGIDQDDAGRDCTDIDDATIDSSIIGGTTPAAGSFTILKASTDPADADGVGDQGFNDGRYCLESNNLSDVGNAATSFSNIKQAATDSVTGVSELSTDAEAVTGTATDRVVTPANITAKMAAPGAIGNTTPATGKFITLEATGNISSDNFKTDEVTTHSVSIGNDSGSGGFYASFIGEHAGEYNEGEYVDTIGFASMQYNIGRYSSALGLYSLRYNDGDYNTAVGVQAFNNWTPDTASAMDITTGNIDPDNNQVTVTGHGYETAINLRASTSITLPSGLNTSTQQWKVIDVNTLQCGTCSFTDTGSGVLTLTPKFAYSNSTAIGRSANPDASNQVMLGDANVTQVKTNGVIHSLGISIDSNTLRIQSDKTPATAGADGNQGDIAWDANYLYVCVSTNTWKRSGLSTW
jgi:hypothetical protein